MPVTTFLNDYEKKTFIVVSDKEVNELLQEVRKIDDRFLLQEQIVITKKFLREPVVTKQYTLYFDYLAPNSNWDIQIINLDHNSKEVVCSYFYGFLAGTKRKRT